MAFITKEDITSHIYEEAIATISRGNDSKLNEAINTATSRVKRCLARYNIETIFNSKGEEKEQYAELITYIKDIAKWHFIAVCNVQTDYEVAKQRYDSAIKELDKIKNSETVAGWPLAETKTQTNFRFGSNPKISTRW